MLVNKSDSFIMDVIFNMKDMYVGRGCVGSINIMHQIIRFVQQLIRFTQLIRFISQLIRYIRRYVKFILEVSNARLPL